MTDSSSNLLFQHRFAVIDQFQFVDYQQDGLFDELCPVPLVPKGMEGDADKLPLCVNLTALPDEVRDRWWAKLETARQEGELPVFGALLEASVPFPHMQAHLVRSLICLGRSKPWNFLLRYYDPRVFAHLCWILQAEQRKLLFGPITRWTWCHEGQWHTTENPDTSDRQMPLLTTPTQWWHIERIGQYNRVREIAGRDDNCSLADQAARISTLLTRAEEVHGLVDEQDRILFAVHGLRHHACFDQHPRLIQLFEELNLDEAGYCDAAALIKPEEWQRIAQDMRQRTFLGARTVLPTAAGE